MEKAIVMVGSLDDGYKVYGPFKDWEEASDWCDKKLSHNEMGWIMLLYDPKDVT